MKTILITELPDPQMISDFTLDLLSRPAKPCTGCWSCWWKTPGLCVSKDLDAFYRAYIHADRAVFFAKVKRGFVSSNMKSLFDRMLPLYLPYMSYKTGESMHVPRYAKYPDIEFYYEDNFDSDPAYIGDERSAARDIFEAYVHRTFYQFHSGKITVRPIREFIGEVYAS